MVLSLIVALVVAAGLLAVARFRAVGRDVTAASDRWTMPLLALLTLGAGIWATLSGPYAPGSGTPQPYSASAPVRALCLVLAAAGLVMLHHHRIVAVLLLAMVGLTSATFAAELGGADVALAVIGMTAVTAGLFAAVLPRIGRWTPRDGSVPARFLRALIAAGGGMAAAMVTATMLLRGGVTLKPMPGLSALALEEALRLPGADNAVALVRLDFRPLDSLAVIGCLAAVACVVPGTRVRPPADPGGTTTGALLPIALLLGLWFLWRGQEEPGGGFIAGLVIALGLLATDRAFRLPAAGAAGLLLAGVTGLAGLAFGPALFASVRMEPVPQISTGLLLDTSLMLVVLGAVALPLARLRED